MQFDAKEPSFKKNLLKTVRVVDGDGIIVCDYFNKNEFEIRLLGIDAPELRKCKKLIKDEKQTHVAGQLLIELGRRAHKHLIEMIPKDVYLTIEIEKERTEDIYGRTLAYVYLPNGTCVNEQMIRDGYAKTFDEFYCGKINYFRQLEFEAKQAGKGLYEIINHF